MTLFDQILFPVDFSARCAGAAPTVAQFARHFESKVTMLHVLEAPFRHFSGPEVAMAFSADELQMQRSRTEMELGRFLEGAFSGVDLSRVVVEGDPAHEIVTYAHDRPGTLIMMPTHGYGRFRRFILGSVTAKVLHDADCPVWTGVHMEQGPEPPAHCCRSVLCCLDLGVRSATILNMAARLTRDLDGARLTVVHAIPATEARPDRYFDQEFQVAARNAARQEIARLLESARLSCEVRVESGDASKVVTQVAKDVHAELVLIGRGTNETILGRMRTHAYAIIRESPCPVISV